MIKVVFSFGEGSPEFQVVMGELPTLNGTTGIVFLIAYKVLVNLAPMRRHEVVLCVLKVTVAVFVHCSFYIDVFS